MNLSLECQQVANYIIEEINKYNKEKSFTDQISLTCGKLQKILYFCDVEYMQKNMGKSLFNDKFLAWPSGPVIPGIYHTYLSPPTPNLEPKYDRFKKIKPTLNQETKDIIDEVLDATKELDTIDLDEFTKIPKSPWAHAYNLEDPKHTQIISKDEMYNFHSKKEHSIIHKGQSLIRKKTI